MNRAFLAGLFLPILCLFAAEKVYAIDPLTNGSPTPNFSNVSTLSTIRGKVEFKRKNTLVPLIGNPLSMCEGGGCPQSNSYWAIMVNDGTRVYEFHQPFAMGASRAPEYVTVQGVMLRPGTEITLVGTIESVTASFGIVSEIRSISVVAEPASGFGMLDSVWGAEGTGWNCASTEEGGARAVGVVVWYGRKSYRDNEAFHLRVLAGEGIADIADIQMRQQGRQIVYEGAASRAAAVLAIQNDRTLVRNFPSMLVISSAPRGLGAPMVEAQSVDRLIPFSGTVRMVCNPSDRPMSF